MSLFSLRSLITRTKHKPNATAFLPLAGHIKIGTKPTETGSLTIIVAPSYQYPGYCYATSFADFDAGGAEIVGARRPMRGDFLTAVVLAHLAKGGIDGMTWRDVPASPWAYNHLLFDKPACYVDFLNLSDDADRAELIDLAKGNEPPDDISAHKAIRVRA